MRLSNPEKVLYPEAGITKLDLARYYEQVQDRILPYAASRPLSLVRCPSGHQDCFYQKHLDASAPKTIGRIPIKEGKETGIYSYVSGLKGLISLVQLGVLEIHPWGSRIEDVDNPDMVIFDLDPSSELPWESLVRAARELCRRLEDFELQSFLKTTGGKGLHVAAPLSGRHTWEEVRGFSRYVAEEMARDNPQAYLSKASKQSRTGKIFVDYLRNVPERLKREKKDPGSDFRQTRQNLRKALSEIRGHYT